MAILAATSICWPVSNSCFAEECLSQVERLRSDFQGGLDRLESEYRAALANAIGLADSAEVSLLEFDLSDDRNTAPNDYTSYLSRSGAIGYGQSRSSTNEEVKFFPVTPYGISTKVHATSVISSSDARFSLLKKSIAEMVSKAGKSSKLAHFPTYGIRLFCSHEGRQVLIFETSLCVKLSNGYITYDAYPNYAKWSDLDTSELRPLLEDITPMPAEYEKRIQDKWSQLTK